MRKLVRCKRDHLMEKTRRYGTRTAKDGRQLLVSVGCGECNRERVYERNAWGANRDVDTRRGAQR